jgi:hypothetical protein
MAMQSVRKQMKILVRFAQILFIKNKAIEIIQKKECNNIGLPNVMFSFTRPSMPVRVLCKYGISIQGKKQDAISNNAAIIPIC